MNAGTELDALVAEKVFGFRISGGLMLRDVPGGGFTAYNIPYYSSDIASAWSLVEKMERQGLQITFTPSNGWYVEISGGICDDREITSAPHAICLAALRAVGVKF